ncbi:hypothetical protein [Blastomonas sp.]|uniref:hypothetical protein n=1 Tax=Blastomonas sp. TaxID=1909299 RepID=UPI0026072AA2|nr:hypothetical protein [Blastomonas sp.]MDM7955535.1 hypothetical protein [Blastomonas sp.]
MRAIRHRNFVALATLSVATALVLSPAAIAQKKATRANPGPVFEGMLQCRSITEDTARLACFDQQVAAFADAEKTGEVIVAERREVEKARESAFGLSVGDSTLLRGPDGEPLKSLSSKVSDLRTLPGSKRLVISLENGSRWEQTDPPSFIFSPRPGQMLVIDRGAMGGYRAKVEGRTGFTRVRRVE